MSIKNRWLEIIIFSVYTLLNLSFLVKYGIRQSIIPLYVLVGLFIIIHILIFRFGLSISLKINKNTIASNFLIIGITLVYIIFCHLINDPYKLNIDRWQTMEYSMPFWLKGKFIYDTPNYLGNMPSYLPGQLLLAAPFYLIGNVGYLQVAALLIFSFTLIKVFGKNAISWLGIFLFSISLSYIYEAICKSDLISSFIIVSSFILLWNHFFKGNYFKYPFLLGLILGLLCLTRSVSVIPLILFFLKPFLETNFNIKIKLSIGFIISFSILLSTVLLPAKNFDYILKYNPLQLQGQANKYVSLFFVILTFILAFYVKNIKQVFYISTFVIFGVMGSFIVETIIKGYTFKYMNFSYWAASLPFCIVSYCYILKDKLEKV